MSTSQPADRFPAAAYAVAAAFTVLCVLPLWVVDLPPLLDMGQHLHMATILHDWARDPQYAAHYVRVPGLTPSWFYPTALDLLAWLRDVEWANRVLLTLCLAAVPWTALWLLRVAGHSPWLVLGVVPWVLNYDFFLGYVDHLAALPIFLALLASHLRWLQAPTWQRGLRVAGLLVWLALTHYLLFGVGLLILPLLALTLGLRRGWKVGLGHGLRDLLFGVPALALLARWAARQAATSGGWKPLLAQPGAERVLPLATLREITERLFDVFEPHGPDIQGVSDLLMHRQGEVVSVLWLIGLGAWTLSSVRQQRLARAEGQRDPIAEHGTAYLSWALFFVILAYFVLPEELRRPIWLYGIHFRLVEVMAILAVLALPLRPAEPRAVPIRTVLGTLAMAAAALWMPLATMQSFLLARTEFGAIRQAYGSIRPGAKVLTLHPRACSRYLHACVLHDIGTWYAVMRGGYVPVPFGDPALQRVQVRADRQLPAPPVEEPESFSWQAHGRYYDYIAVYKDLGEPTLGFESQFKNLPRVYQRGHWQVFQNLQPVAFPEPTPEALREQQQRASMVEYVQWLAGLQGMAQPHQLPVALRVSAEWLARLGWNQRSAAVPVLSLPLPPPAPPPPAPELLRAPPPDVLPSRPRQPVTHLSPRQRR